MRIERFSPTTTLLINGVILVVVGAVTAVLGLGLQRLEWAISWLIAGLFLDEVVLYLLLCRTARPIADVERLAASLSTVLEAQSAAIEQQEQQIARLYMVVTDQEQNRKAWGEHALRARSNLSSLIGGLEQAEASLPDMLCQTRDWVAQMRHLATRIRTQVDGFVDEVAAE